MLFFSRFVGNGLRLLRVAFSELLLTLPIFFLLFIPNYYLHCCWSPIWIFIPLNLFHCSLSFLHPFLLELSFRKFFAEFIHPFSDGDFLDNLAVVGEDTTSSPENNMKFVPRVLVLLLRTSPFPRRSASVRNVAHSRATPVLHSVTVPSVSFPSSQCVNLLPVFSVPGQFARALPANPRMGITRRSCPRLSPTSSGAPDRVTVKNLLSGSGGGRASWWGRGRCSLLPERSAFPTGGTHSFARSRATRCAASSQGKHQFARGHVSSRRSAPSSG